MLKVFVAIVALTAAGCGGNSSRMTPLAPSAVSTPAPTTGSTGATGTSTATGTWTGVGTDSSSNTLGAGGMMGQARMGLSTWQLIQMGSSVTGTVTFAGMHGRIGTFTGTMSDDHNMAFTMNMPSQGMMGSNCSTYATGTAHMDPATMTLNCTYSGTNSCSGPFMNGRMTMARR